MFYISTSMGAPVELNMITAAHNYSSDPSISAIS